MDSSNQGSTAPAFTGAGAEDLSVGTHETQRPVSDAVQTQQDAATAFENVTGQTTRKDSLEGGNDATAKQRALENA